MREQKNPMKNSLKLNKKKKHTHTYHLDTLFHVRFILYSKIRRASFALILALIVW